MEFPQKYFTLVQLAQKWGRFDPEMPDRIMGLLVDGELKAVVTTSDGEDLWIDDFHKIRKVSSWVCNSLIVYDLSDCILKMMDGRPYRPPVKSPREQLGFYKYDEDCIKIPLAEVERFEKEFLSTEQQAQVASVKEIARHEIPADKRGRKPKGAFITSVEKYLDANPDGDKAGFYDFIKDKLQLAREEVLKDGQTYQYFFDDVVKKGSREGIYLKHPKEGKKPGDAGFNHYSGSDITTALSREKGKRKKTTI